VFNGTALAALIVAALVGILIFPPAFIPIAAACIGFLSVEVTLLTLAANYIRDNREEWVCAIYNADSTEEAIAVLADLIDALVSAIGTTGGQGFWVKQLILLLCNTDTINQAMHNTAHQTYPDADCSGCGNECVGSDLTEWTVVDGTALITEPNTLRVQPVQISGYWYSDILISFPSMNVNHVTFSVSSSDAIQFSITSYTYTSAVPYPGQYEATNGENQTPPISVDLEPASMGITEIQIAMRPVATNTQFGWIEVSDMCIS